MIVIIILSLFVLLHSLRSNLDISGAFTIQLTTIIPQVLSTVFPSSVFLSLFIHLLLARTYTGSRLMKFIIPLGAACATLVFCLPAFMRMPDPEDSGSDTVSTSVGTSHLMLPEKELITFNGYMLFAGAAQNDRLSDVILVDGANFDPALEYYNEGRIIKSHNEFVLSLSSVSNMLKLTPISSLSTVFQTDFLISLFISDIVVFNQALEELYKSERSVFYLLGFSFVFFIVASSMVLHFTRWRLFNVLFMFALARGSFTLYSFFRTGISAELNKLFDSNLLIELAPIVFVFCCGVFVILVDLLFIPSFHREGS